MKLTIVDTTGNLANIEMDDESPIEDLKAMIEVEMKIPFAQQNLYFENKKLDNKATLKSSGIKDGDMLNVENNQFANILGALQNMARQGGGNQQQNWLGNMGGMNQANQMNQALKKEAEDLKRHYQTNSNDLQYILHQNPEFAQAVLNDDINVLIEYIRKHKENKMKEKMKQMERIRKLEEDPFNPENQRLIEEEIRMKNVDEHLELAQEFTPESFGSVTMLYVDAKINGHPIQAFVDSGAQSTIMSHVSAERCGILRLLDKRFAGIAMGVGTSRILGRIHVVNLQIGEKFFQCSITVLEDDKIDFLLGLDMLKRHQCCIDLNKNVLTFHAGETSVPFLHEGEIKKHFSAAANKAAHSEKVTTGKDTAEPKPSQPSNPTSGFPEQDINKLVGLGFPRQQAIDALKVCGGNVDMAASLLFQS